MSVCDIDCTPCDITLPNGTTHRLWLDDDNGNTVIRVEGETITREHAQEHVDMIFAEITYGEDSTSDGI